MSASENSRSTVHSVKPTDVLQKLRIVIRAAQRHSAWTEKQCGVTGAQLWVMQELNDVVGLRVGEIAARLAIHQTTASNLIETLVKKGLIVRTRDVGDQRVVRLAMSDKGKDVFAAAPKPARGLLPEALRALDAAAIRELDSGLQSLLVVIGAVDEAHGMLPLSFTM